MQQRIDGPRPGHRGGLIKRLFPGHPHIVDLTSVYPVNDDDVMARLERLEDGVRVIAETLRKTSLRLWGSIEEVRASAGAMPAEEVRQIVAGALAPLSASLEALATALEGTPREGPSAFPRIETEPAEDGTDSLTALRRARFGEPGEED
jgi:hypothetical protein